MSRITIGIVFVIQGVMLVTVSLAADALGIGNWAGISWSQILWAAVGALVAIGGAFWGWGKK